MALRFAWIILILGLFAPFTAGQTATTRSTASITGPSAADRSAEGLRVCYARDGICAASNDLGDQCRTEEDAHGLDGYWKCACTSGLAAVEEACDDCRLFYGVITDRILNYTVTCSRKSHTLAPIPSSVLAQQSSHNATRGTAAPKTQEPTYVVTINAMPPASLPTVATTFALPLATGAASRSLVADSWLLGVFPILGVSWGFR